jgi:hypothetical protein
MKKTFKIFLALCLVIITAFSAVSCGDGLKTYSENGLIYKLPKEMKKGNVPVEIADTYYYNEDVEFFIYFITRDALLVDYYLDKDCTPEEYAEDFVSWMGYENVTTVKGETGYVIVYYVYESETESDFYFDYIIRNEETLFHVTMCCDPENAEKNLPIFFAWAENIRLK